MGRSPRHLFLHHSLSPWVIYLLSASFCSINTRATGHWEKHLAFCTQIVSTAGPANPSQTPAMNISPAWPGSKKTAVSSTLALLFLEREKCFQHRLQCAKAHCCKTWARRRHLQSSALLLDGLMLYLLRGSGGHQSAGTVISLPARAVSWYLLVASKGAWCGCCIFPPSS